MLGSSPIHIVPECDMMMPGVHDETFYSQVLSGPSTHAQMMESSDSDCSSEDGKVYMSLKQPEHQMFAHAPSTMDKVMSTESNLYSWRNRHPKNWVSHDISNWIYCVCSSSTHMDSYKIQAEKFQGLRGEDICLMSPEQFLNLEPNYGWDLYNCLQESLKHAHYKAPVDDILQYEELAAVQSISVDTELDNSAMWSAAAMMAEEDQDMDLSSCELIETTGLLSATITINNKSYDFLSDDGFDDILPKPSTIPSEESGYGSDDSVGSMSRLETVPPPAHMTYPYSSVATSISHQFSHHAIPPPAHMNQSEAYYQSCDLEVPPVKTRGRPKKEGSTRGRKPGTATKGTHLWKFIRDVINDSRFNPDIIRWENQDQGIFRIVNSAEIARLWGEKKNNPTMTYEKFSRAMRYCRKQGDFGSLPKDQNLPKKLCFRFGGSRIWTL